MIIPFLLGVTLTLWLTTVLGAAYGAYRYVYRPWIVVRADQAALRATLEEIKLDLGARKAFALTPAQLKSLEQDQRMRGLAAALESPGLNL